MNDMTLPSISNAQLPRSYEAAKAALAECGNIDECKSWSDRAAALASYAKQAEDDGLLKMATRIKARAVRRSGELLKQIKAATGKTKGIGGDTFSRTDAAREAGMSKRQQNTAMRVSNIPDADFEEQVESDTPPTLTQLAQQGIQRRPVVDLNGRDPSDYNKAMHFVGDFEHFARTLADMDIEGCCAILSDSERTNLRVAIQGIDAATDQIVGRI